MYTWIYNQSNMYISARCIGIVVFIFSAAWIVFTVPVEMYLNGMSNTYGCNIVRSVQTRHITSTCVLIFVGQTGYAVLALILFFICILMCRGDLMCDIMTEKDRYGYAVVSTEPTPETSPRGRQAA